MSKKEESRFNIRFNPADPTHQITIEILSHAGRSKANLIANAIAFYLKMAGDESAAYIPESMSHGRIPKIKSERRRKKPTKPQANAVPDRTAEHEIIASMHTETLETSQFSTPSFAEADENENPNGSLSVNSPEVQSAVLNMLSMFRG